MKTNGFCPHVCLTKMNLLEVLSRMKKRKLVQYQYAFLKKRKTVYNEVSKAHASQTPTQTYRVL